MNSTKLLPLAAILAIFALAACANTIRGAGQDVRDSAEAVEDVVE